MEGARDHYLSLCAAGPVFRLVARNGMRITATVSEKFISRRRKPGVLLKSVPYGAEFFSRTLTFYQALGLPASRQLRVRLGRTETVRHAFLKPSTS